MLVKLPRTLKPSFNSRLSRQLGIWVFLGILGIEAMIFLPSAYRRNQEQLDTIQMTAMATVRTLIVATPELRNVIQSLPKLKQEAPLIGAILYSGQGATVYEMGRLKTLTFQQAQAQQQRFYPGQPWRYEISIPVSLKEGQYYLVLIYDATLVHDDLVSYSIRVLGLVLLISISVTILMIWIINQKLIYPILILQSDLQKSGEAIASGQTIEEFESQGYTSNNELLEVMQAFHRTHYQIVSAQAQLIQTEKMSSLGQLGAGFAHEINNPINFIDANLKHLKTYGRDLLEIIEKYEQEVPEPSIELQEKIEEADLNFIKQDMQNLIASMQSGATRIRDLVVSFRNFVRLDEADQKAVNIHDGLESTLVLLQSQFVETEYRPAIDIQNDYAELPLIFCYPKQLNQVFIYLITNAIEAIDRLSKIHALEQPHIIVRTTKTDHQVFIEISDNGIGIETETQSKIFNPFFTTKDVGQGMGLGLTNSYRIINEIHHGHLKFHSQVKQGTTFRIELPIVEINQ